MLWLIIVFAECVVLILCHVALVVASLAAGVLGDVAGLLVLLDGLHLVDGALLLLLLGACLAHLLLILRPASLVSLVSLALVATISLSVITLVILLTVVTLVILAMFYHGVMLAIHIIAVVSSFFMTGECC